MADPFHTLGASSGAMLCYIRTMSFVMPKDIPAGEAPTPRDPRVNVKNVAEGEILAVREFPGTLRGRLRISDRVALLVVLRTTTHHRIAYNSRITNR